MEHTKTTKQLGTKWFTFYTKVRPWIACLMVFSVIGDFMRFSKVYTSYWWLLLYLIASLAQPILSVIVAIKSSGDYIEFVRFVKGVLLFETVSISYSQGVQQYMNNDFNFGFAFIGFTIMFVISFSIWFCPNVKYFEKRIPLFTNDCPENDLNRVLECKACGYRDKNSFNDCPRCGRYAKRYVYLNEEPTADTDKIRFCRKCGEKLIDNSRFCRKCGTEIVD